MTPVFVTLAVIALVSWALYRIGDYFNQRTDRRWRAGRRSAYRR